MASRSDEDAGGRLPDYHSDLCFRCDCTGVCQYLQYLFLDIEVLVDMHEECISVTACSCTDRMYNVRVAC